MKRVKYRAQSGNVTREFSFVSFVTREFSFVCFVAREFSFVCFVTLDQHFETSTFSINYQVSIKFTVIIYYPMYSNTIK